jgi:flagellar biosynthesis protein FlhF
MIIKSFTGESAAAALKKVRAEMGGEAVVLKTRQLPGSERERIEITACVDREPETAPTTNVVTAPESRLPDDVAQTATEAVDHKPEPETERTETVSAPDPAAMTRSLEQRLVAMEEILGRVLSLQSSVGKPAGEHADAFHGLHVQLKDADLPDDIIRSVLTTAMHASDTPTELPLKTREVLIEKLSAMIDTRVEFKAGDRVVIIGPPASGKSAVMGKLAAHLVLNAKRKVKLVSLDNLKIAAFEEIQSYGDLLGLDVSDSESSDSFSRKHVTLVDTPAISPDTAKLASLLEKIRSIKPTHCLLTLSALTRSSDIELLLNQLREFMPTHIVMTMMDLTRRYGSLTTACDRSGVKLAFINNAPGGIGMIERPKAETIVDSMLLTEVSHE